MHTGYKQDVFVTHTAYIQDAFVMHTGYIQYAFIRSENKSYSINSLFCCKTDIFEPGYSNVSSIFSLFEMKINDSYHKKKIKRRVKLRYDCLHL